MRYKIFLLWLSFVLPVITFAYDCEVDGIYYNLNKENNSASVTKMPNNGKYRGKVNVPSSITYEGAIYSVISIGEYAFYACSGLTSILIPNSVTSIDEYAFTGCSYLTSVIIGNSVISIGEYAFWGCRGLTSIIIPNSVTFIGESAFSNCSGLTSINIPNSVTSIDQSVFCDCRGLSSITIPNSVTSIGQSAFSGCSGLTSITIPNSVTSIGQGAFSGCSGLTSIDISNSVTSIDQRVFWGCSNLESVTIPNSVKSIGLNAFYKCNKLTSVTIPNSVTSISSDAFYNCNRLTSVTVEIIDIATWRTYIMFLLDDPYLSSCTYHLSLGGKVIKDMGRQKAYFESITKAWCPSSYTVSSLKTLKELTEERNDFSLVQLHVNDGMSCDAADIYSIFYYATTQYSANHFAPLGASKLNIINNALISTYNHDWLSSNIDKAKAMPALANVNISADYNNKTRKLKIKITGERNEEFELLEGYTNLTVLLTEDDVVAPQYDGEQDKYIYDFKHQAVLRTNVSAVWGDPVVWNGDKYEMNYTVTLNESWEKDNMKIVAFLAKPFNGSNYDEIYVKNCNDFAIKDANMVPLYTLTYIVDGEIYKTEEMEYGEKITTVVEPTKEGYTFSGWSEIPSSMPAKNITINGSFTINKYKLTYMVDGEIYKTSEVEYGASITAEANPTKEGYTFSGWSEMPAKMPAKDVFITGSFCVNSYTLSYIIDGVEYKTMSVEYGSAITAEIPPTKEGYSFSGWIDLPTTMPAHNVTITGSFSINQYKLIYVVDNQEYQTIAVIYGAEVNPLGAPYKEGYTFGGWSEIPNTMPAHDVTITGSFKINLYTLTYIVDGTEYKDTSVEYGAVITPEATPTKEGYTFSGWSEMPKTMPAHDVTVTGSFSINSYTLTYIVDGAEYKTASIEYGSAITAESTPTKEGHTFSGWSEIPTTMPAHDVTVTGSFIVNKYKLIYMVDGNEYQTLEVEYGEEIYPIGDPTKEGYSFDGWENLPEETMPAHDVVVTGAFTINTYKLTYVVDGEIYKTYEVEYGTSITGETEPTKEGYAFSGWNEIPATMPANDVIVTGSFTYLDAIDNIIAEDGIRQIYTSDGKPVNALQKGVNIIYMNDGRVMKVFVK